MMHRIHKSYSFILTDEIERNSWQLAPRRGQAVFVVLPWRHTRVELKRRVVITW